jgi:mRNA-degrading endonuclease RelE of RelBE toxin-antitoxin system
MKIKKVEHIVSASGQISLLVQFDNGTVKPEVIASDHLNHKKIVSALKRKDYSDLETLLSIEKTKEVAAKKVQERLANADVERSLVGKAELRDGVVFVNNVPVHNVVADRILELANQGYEIDPVLRFLERVLMNPSAKSQEELYDFLANRNLPLTEDGHFLAYKRVRDDWMDFFSGKIYNGIGAEPEVEREGVDPNRNNECSHGLHVGALEYVRKYHSGGHIVICKVDPYYCVSVPQDHNAQKIRVCKYKVLYELHDDKELEHPVYTSQGGWYDGSDEWLEDNAKDSYWESGWDDDYASWTVDELSKELVRRKLLPTREDGRKIARAAGKEELVDMMREDDEESDDSDDDLMLDDYEF